MELCCVVLGWSNRRQRSILGRSNRRKYLRLVILIVWGVFRCRLQRSRHGFRAFNFVGW